MQGADEGTGADILDGRATGWSTRSAMDVGASQFGWLVAALAADEADLAHRLVREPAVGSEHDEWRTAGLAETLVLTGRSGEARRTLEAAGVRPPGADGPVSWSQMLLATTYAAGGDAAAWSWLTARLAEVPHHMRPRLTRLVAFVADQRGDLDVADSAWLSLVQMSGATSIRLAERSAVATIGRRSRQGAPAEILTALFSAHATLRETEDDKALVLDAVIRAAHALGQRGDRAGARLLLRLADRSAPRNAALRRVSRELRSPMTGTIALKTAGIVLLGALITVGFVVWGVLASHDPMVGARVAILLALPLGLLVRRTTVPGLTVTESRVWRGLGTLRYDPSTGRATNEGTSGWYGVAGIVGAVATFTVIAIVLTRLTPTGTWPLWAVSGSSMLLWLALTAFGAAGGVLAMRRVRHGLTRRRQKAARAAQQAQAERSAGVCTCWDTYATWGRSARLLVEHHLTVPGPPVPLPLPDAQVRLCPTTGLPWIVGRLGAHGRFVALRGALRDVDDSSNGAASTGLYL